jgi:hypothetical protein
METYKRDFYTETEADEAENSFCNDVKPVVISNQSLELSCQCHLASDVVLQT